MMIRNRYSFMPPDRHSDSSDTARLRIRTGKTRETQDDVDNYVSGIDEESIKALRPDIQLGFWRGLWWPE